MDDPFLRYCRDAAVTSRQSLGVPLSGSEASSWPARLESPPTPDEFGDLVARHVPMLIDGCLGGREALSRWKDTRYLLERMGERDVTVAVTPDGRADDLATLPDGSGERVLALPHEARMPFATLIDRLRNPQQGRVYYLQSQDSNLESGEFDPLLQDLGGPHDWASKALGAPPAATNIWIGTASSRTSMHRDHYENLFTVLRGWKEFTVFPPQEGRFLCDEEEVRVFRYNEGMQLVPEPGAIPTRWIAIDPTQAKDSARNAPYAAPTREYSLALDPLRIRVHAGETLYLPSGWYHHVAQQEDEDGLCLCVNWWYEITDEMALYLAEMDGTLDT